MKNKHLTMQMTETETQKLLTKNSKQFRASVMISQGHILKILPLVQKTVPKSATVSNNQYITVNFL